MKTTNLNAFEDLRIDQLEMKNVNGGGNGKMPLPYMPYTWSGTDNGVIYTAEGIWNGIKLGVNFQIWQWNLVYG